jgi:hypothetical protein
MPLLDHFKPPLLGRRHWESLHALWLSELVGSLNRGILPERYFAEAQVHVGGHVEVDLASFHDDPDPISNGSNGNGGVAVAVQTCSPPLTITSLPLVFPDDIELQVYSTDGGPTLVGAVELISPGNKDRPEARLAFAAKCANYLNQGIGLVIIDIVTDRLANLHNELIELMRQDAAHRFPSASSLYAVSYHPARLPTRVEQARVSFYELAIDKPLPTLPLPLRGGPTVPLYLESAYMEARTRSRL